MSDSSTDRDPLDRLAEEFVARFRAGERPSVEEFAARLPDRADEVRDLFPALVEMEQLKPVTGDRTGDFAPATEPTDPPRVGEFRVLRRVGVGGMGVVYEAVQESLGRHVALKLLPPEALLDPRRLERFRREAKSAARLHHTNIVPVFGVGEADGRHYYAMQFISGHPLDAVIDEVRRLKGQPQTAPGAARAASEVAAALVTGSFARVAVPVVPDAAPAPGSEPASAEAAPALSGSLSGGGASYWATVARVGAQVADALAYAHGQGVLHRDIKPANLLLDLSGTVWVTDFGLAKSADADDLTQMGDIVGTLRYMAPERFDGAGDHRADIYALGLTLYELLTLTPAFTAENRAKLVQEVTAANPRRPRAIDPAIPRDLETVVLKCVARDPALRYQRAAELADDLRRFTEDRPIRARRASSAEQAFRWCRRNPAVASLLTAVVLVFAAGAAASAFFAVQAERREKDARDEAARADANAALAGVREREADGERNRAKAATEQARREKEYTRRLLYDSLMSRAGAALNDDKIPLVRQLLEETKPQPGESDIRGWEWHYLYRLLNPTPDWTARVETGPKPWYVSTLDDLRTVTSRASGEGVVLDVRETRTGRQLLQIPKSGTLPRWFERKADTQETSLYLAHPTKDGKHLAAVLVVPANGEVPVQYRLRIWNIDTGDEVPGPTELLTTRPPVEIAVGKDAASVVWIKPSMRSSNPTAPLKVLPETIYRWDRATGRVTSVTVQSTDPSDLALSPDGMAVFAVPLSSAETAILGAYRPGLRLECWDLTPDGAKLRWPTAIPVKPTPSRNPHVRLSEARTVAATWDGEEIQISRLSDGKLLWRMKHRGGERADGEEIRQVSDDGTRVAIFKPHKIVVVARTGGPTAELNGDGKEVPAREIPCYLLRRKSDGWNTATFVGYSMHADCRSVWEWDAKESTVTSFDVSGDLKATDALPDIGTVARVEQQPDENRGAKQFHWVVLNRAGKVILHPENQSSGSRPAPLSLHLGGRRALMQNSVFDKSDPRGRSYTSWTLYALDTPGGSQMLKEGKGWADIDEADGVLRVWTDGNTSPWIDGIPSPPLSLVTGKPVAPTADLPTGVVGRVLKISPTGETYAWITTPPTPAEPNAFSRPKPLPITVRLHETASGKEIWSREIGAGRNADLVYSPNGQRICVVYNPDQFTPFIQQNYRLWMGRTSDGSGEQPIPLPQIVGQSAAPIRKMLQGFTPDGKLLIVVGGEVQIWNPETGALVHRLSDHERVEEVYVDPDNSRLFVKDLGKKTRIHVWDLTTGRELLILETPSQDWRNLNPVPFALGSKFYIRGTDAIHVLDGTPVKP